MKKLILSFVVILFCYFCSAETLYISHRGESVDAPENTMASFRLAWGRGTDGIECDVRWTADKQVIVFHDGTTGRVAGANLNVAKSSAEELRKLDVGSFRGKQFAGEKIPLLSELLSAMPEKGLIYLELKSYGHDFCEAVAALIHQYKRGPEQVRFISFSADAIQSMKELLPEYRAYLLAGFSWDPKKQNVDKIIKKAKEIKADGVNLDFSKSWSKALVKKIRDAGLEVHCYTVDDAWRAHLARKLGIDSIISDCAHFLMVRAKH